MRPRSMNQETRSKAAKRASRRRIAVAVALATTVAGCGSGGGTVDESNARPAVSEAPTTAGKDLATKAIADAAAKYDRAAPAKAAPTKATVDGIAAFAADLYTIAAKSDENIVFSPLSIAYAFAMARAGARGETAAQLDKAFGFPAGRDSGFNALTNGLASSSAPPSPKPAASKDRDPAPGKPILTLANALFVQRDYRLVDGFLRAMTEQYGSEVVPFDLANPDAAVAVVNEWADLHTAGRIPKVFDHLDPATRLVIANAVYLKADWTIPFKTWGEGDFAVGGKPVQVPMMNRESSVGYAKGPGWQAVELPYFGGRLAMRVLLPTGTKTPADLLTPAVLAAAARTRPTDVEVTMPKWDFGTDFDLKALMIKLGVTHAFDDSADFSGISDSEQLVIDQAIHKANITVDELGTVASAVTALSAVATSARAHPPLRFTVDRPFAFEIVDLRTGAPLFLGHVADPRAK
jgi:serpin B